MRSIVIYVDVLFVVNFFINFLLLELTAKLMKRSAKLYRIIISSAVGGLYSLIILVDELPSYLLVLSKILVALIMVSISFSFVRVSTFFKAIGIFLFSSFVLLGVVVGIYFITKSHKIAINNSTIYFDITAKELLLSALFAYLVSCFVVRLHNRSLSKNEIYSLEIENAGQSIKLNALLDTGNKLREPFSNCPVIVVDSVKCEELIGTSMVRYIPSSTINGESLLKAFKPERVVIKASKGSEIVDNVYVALSNDIKTDGFSAIINPDILSV